MFRKYLPHLVVFTVLCNYTTLQNFRKVLLVVQFLKKFNRKKEFVKYLLSTGIGKANI
jgi:hypothetical protein